MLGILCRPRILTPCLMRTSNIVRPVDARRGVRFDDWAPNFRKRSRAHRAEMMRIRYPRPGPLAKVQPRTPLYRVRLLRSPRHLPKKIRKSAETLGFGKDDGKMSGITRHQTVWVKQTALNAGRILKIKELVRVMLCTEADRREELHWLAGRKERLKGYEVIGRATDDDVMDI